jgi:hypothetical protein
MRPITQDNVIDAAQALYWYCALNYSGQWSGLYRILCASSYRPGAIECGPGDDTEASDIYDELTSGAIDPEDLDTAIRSVL